MLDYINAYFDFFIKIFGLFFSAETAAACGTFVAVLIFTYMALKMMLCCKGGGTLISALIATTITTVLLLNVDEHNVSMARFISIVFVFGSVLYSNSDVLHIASGIKKAEDDKKE
jgi:hypothetical protein